MENSKFKLKSGSFRAASVKPWSNDNPSDAIAAMQADSQKLPKI